MSRRRSYLAVPASKPEMVAKAARSDADAVFIDLEDSVHVDGKETARANAASGITDLPWGSRAIGVRINALGTPWWHRDLCELVASTGTRLQFCIVPKVGAAHHLEAVAALLDGLEREHGLTLPIELVGLIESAEGIMHLDEIASACPGRLTELVFGAGDFAASLGSPITAIGASDSRYAVLADGVAGTGSYPADLWHHAMASIVVACRAHGLRAVDGPLGDVADAGALEQAASRALLLGFDGKWAIHPAQLAIVNDVFTPSASEVARARAIVAAVASGQHGGATSVDGQMLDAASVRMARRVLDRAESSATP